MSMTMDGMYLLLSFWFLEETDWPCFALSVLYYISFAYRVLHVHTINWAGVQMYHLLIYLNWV